LAFVSFQIAIGTDDVYKTAEVVRQNGGQITREPGPLPGISTKITACTDPDGWKSVCISSCFGATVLLLFYLCAWDRAVLIMTVFFAPVDFLLCHSFCLRTVCCKKRSKLNNGFQTYSF
jgi:hypothetical protein